MAELPTPTRFAHDGSGCTAVTRAGSAHRIWRFRTDIPALDFQPDYFSDDWLQRTGAIVSQAGAGRGVTRFIALDGHRLVLRRYRRGGVPRLVSRRRFLWTGLVRSRPMREFDILCRLEQRELPAPRVFAVELVRVAGGLAYEASLLSFTLPGVTLADCLSAGELDAPGWSAVGDCIARFHAAGVEHADLNAHNILLDDTRVSLIDFDRARLHQAAVDVRCRQANLDRLHRSLTKLGSRSDDPARWTRHWAALGAAHAQALASAATGPA